VIRDELGLDCRRAFATVVIGHSMHCGDYSRVDVSEALRIYNSHLSRIEVVTYEDLLAGAERALDITSPEDARPPAKLDRVDDVWGSASSDPWSPSPGGSGWSDEPPF
jgi:hypothetical protein